MSEHRYLHADEKYEEELSRLRLQERFVDPNTIRHLETIGVYEDWKCPEAGAGDEDDERATSASRRVDNNLLFFSKPLGHEHSV
jgi:hypothetical protein